MVIDRGSRAGRLAGFSVSAATVVATLLLAAAPAVAAPVSVHDDSHVLDVTRVQNEAATLPDPVEIYTTTKDADDKAAFDRETQSKVTSPAVVVIAVNTQSHHLAIRTGTRSRVTQPTAATATQAFIGSYRGSHDYTAATVAALDSLRAGIQAVAPAQHTAPRHTTSHAATGVSIGGVICLLVVAGVVIAILARRRRRPSGPIGGFGAADDGFAPTGYGPPPGSGPGYQAGYQPGYQPGYGPGYQPGYGPGYGQPGRSSVSPWVAGGVGAAAGGLLGYELAREQDREHEEREYQEREREDRAEQGQDSGGGGADGDFGGDNGGDNGNNGDF
jgi:hypothetical protein